MALSQLRPTVIEGDRPASKSDFVRLPGGGLILTGQKPVEAKPGMLAGLRDYFAAKLRPQPVQDQYWIAQPAPATPVAAPVSTAPGMPLPNYDAWSAIEEEAAKEQRIKERLGTVSSNILNSPQIIEGKWFR